MVPENIHTSLSLQRVFIDSEGKEGGGGEGQSYKFCKGREVTCMRSISPESFLTKLNELLCSKLMAGNAIYCSKKKTKRVGTVL